MTALEVPLQLSGKGLTDLYSSACVSVEKLVRLTEEKLCASCYLTYDQVLHNIIGFSFRMLAEQHSNPGACGGRCKPDGFTGPFQA